MSSLETRLARLERIAEKTCDGHHITYRLASNPNPAPPPRCPWCGREAQVVVFVSPYDDPVGATP